MVETTRELACVFVCRNLQPQEPFAGACLAGFPNMWVLAPSQSFYRRMIGEFAEIRDSIRPRQLTALTGLRGNSFNPFPNLPPVTPYQAPKHTTLATLLSSSSPIAPPLSSLSGLLRKSSVKENPTTQPFNETSVILGVKAVNGNLLFTGDAGAKALSFISADWNNLLYMGVPHHASDGNLSQSDIERFCPRFAIISAKGDSSHPSRAIVNGFVKVGTKLASTHKSGNLWFYCGNVPSRTDYSSAELLKGNAEPSSVVDWTRVLAATAGMK